MTIQNTEASVKIENLTSKPFLISSGVRQGDPLSAAMFNLMLDSVVIKKLNLRVNITMYELARTQLYLNMVHGVVFTINYMFRPLYWPSSGLHYA